MTDLI